MIITALALCGCESLDLSWDDVLGKSASGESEKKDGKFEPKYVLTFHLIVEYPRAEEIEKMITTFDGKKVWINTNFLAHTRDIKQVKLVERKGEKDFYDLALQLDKRGKMKWIQLTAHSRHSEIAILLDGVYHSQFTPEVISNEDVEWIIIPGPFDPVSAKGIVKYAQKNYEFYNPDINRIF
jgi:hypothetical protein